jgi:antitoxin (DNA-binding transcriptional repressor) of toxin-antitoxin stability system
MSVTIGLKDLRDNMDEYISRVDNGESLIVMRRSRAVFKLVPPDDNAGWERAVDFTKFKKQGVSLSDVLAII